jgi:hypothetical protein
MAVERAGWGVCAALTALAIAVRTAWVLAVPTVPVSDFAMYRESANYLSEFGRLDSGFIYMPGFVALLAAVQNLGGGLVAQKMLGVLFGGIGAAGLYVAAFYLFESRRVAVVATLGYALWPAGIALSSVVGTDVPAAALLVAAIGVLAALGPRRPWLAAVLFGVVMGLAAWVRAVALPLSGLALGYWLARRTRWPRALALTVVGVAATLAVLAPWAARHARESGQLYFTDDHGGITALLGANPNSEGTYTRALNQLFRDVTGRGVLDEPHREVDQAAYALAKDWMRFEPAYALGLSARRAERLFDLERYLLYWPVFRPGVLVGAPAAWFEARREGIDGAVDAIGAVIGALAIAGVVLALLRRRWPALALVPFQLALAATYIVFFAEPRYRVPIELLAFPFAALALVELADFAVALARRARPELRRTGVPLALAAVVVLIAEVAWPALGSVGASLRARHRWAADVWRVGGGASLAKWRDLDARASSALEGGAGGVKLTVDAGRTTTTAVEVSGTFQPGAWRLSLDAAASAPASLRIEAAAGTLLADVAVPAGPPLHVVTAVVLDRAQSPLRFTVKASASAPATLIVSGVGLDHEAAPGS